MRVLITGAAGFTGYYVQQALETYADTVIGLESDLNDAPGLAAEIKAINPDAVVHLAAITFVAHGNVNDFYMVNLLGTQNLLHCLHLYAPNVKSILLASSANIYGNHPAGVLTEATLPNPGNDYSISKWAMEKMAGLWLNRLPLFIVRPFNYTGVGQNEQFLIPKIVAHFVQKKEVITLGNIDVIREFNDVRMIAQIYATLLHQAPIGEIVNICTGVGHSIHEILTLCQQMSGHVIQTEISSHFIRHQEVKSLIGDPTKLKKLIGDFASPPIRDTLQWMLISH